MKRATMKMLSCLVTESLKIGKWQKYIYINISYADTFYISWGLGAIACYIFGSEDSKKANDVWKPPTSKPTCSAFVFVF